MFLSSKGLDIVFVDERTWLDRYWITSHAVSLPCSQRQLYARIGQGGTTPSQIWITLSLATATIVGEGVERVMGIWGYLQIVRTRTAPGHQSCFCLLSVDLWSLMWCVDQDQRLREAITIGSPDCALEDKMLTIAHGLDMINISYTNFATTSKEIAKVRKTRDFNWTLFNNPRVCIFVRQWRKSQSTSRFIS